MTKKLKRKQLMSLMLAAALCGTGFSVVGCQSSTTVEDYYGVQNSAAFDPSKPVVISQFTPNKGSVGQQIVIEGSNFGNDPEKIQVTIGGKKAVVVSVRSTSLYAYVPSAAYDKIEGQNLSGSVEVSVTDGNTTQSATAPGVFTYERKMVVGRLCGKPYEDAADAIWLDGSFADGVDNVSGFKNDGVMQFSPYNHDQLFIVYDHEPRWDGAHGIQLLDLKEKTVKTILPLSKFSGDRLRTIDFAVDPFMYNEDGTYAWRLDEDGNKTGYANPEWETLANHDQLKWREHLIVAADNGISDETYRSTSVYIVDRDPNGDFSSQSKVSRLAIYRTCNGASLHPNGELYFTSYTQGEVIRLDMDTYWNTILPDSVGGLGTNWSAFVNDNLYNSSTGTSTGSGAFQKLFTVQDTSWEFQIDIHPSGKYAYIVVINKSYILRTDYNEKTKCFTAPYRIAGDMSNRGFQDGVGLSALFRRPYQGTFVKNEQYEAAGKDDIYDFYFCDSENDAIRLLTPEGIVKTYAGGSAATHADGYTYGNENGELRDFARFHRPTGLVNDVHRDAITGQNTLIFYILDTNNYCIRTITMEENSEGETGGNEDNTTNE